MSTVVPPPVALSEAQARAYATTLVEQVAAVVRGSRTVAELAVVALLAEGHILLEDVPGVGKTTLAKVLARSIDGTAGRIQFTPDLMASDLIGAHIYRAGAGEFEFVAGPVFANVVIGDEINRASPKTQSALLEAMQERQVTLDGTTYLLPHPFTVIATQNPIEMEGTYPLPEAQRDRFMVRLTIGYPELADEIAMLDAHEQADPLDAITPVMNLPQILGAIAAARRLFVAPAVKHYVAQLARSTRQTVEVGLGASPRAAIQLLRAAKARALIAGRSHVLPDDIQYLIKPVWAHRLGVARSARQAGWSPSDILDALVARIPVR